MPCLSKIMKIGIFGLEMACRALLGPFLGPNWSKWPNHYFLASDAKLFPPIEIQKYKRQLLNLSMIEMRINAISYKSYDSKSIFFAEHQILRQI